MDDPHAPGPLERVGEVVRDAQRLVLGHRAAVPQAVAQALALDVLHDDVGEAVALPRVERAHDVGVVEAREHRGLGLEALDLRAVAREVGAEDLHRHLAVEAEVERAVDRAHRAAADHLEQAVAVDLARAAALGLDLRVDAPSLVLGEVAALDEDHREPLVEAEVLGHPALQLERLLDLRVGRETERDGLLGEEEVLVRRHRSSSSSPDGAAGGAGTRPRSRRRSRRTK